MAIINSGSFTKALWPGINKWYGKAYDEHQVEWTDLFDSFTSRKAWEEDVGISSFGLMKQKPQGQAVEFDTETQGFITRYTHVTYALGFIVTREAVEDDLYDVVGEKKSRGLAFSMRQTKEINGANIYNRATDTNYVYGDGKELLATDRPNIAGGTWANELTTAADLSEASLEQACIDIMKLENDRGLNISIMPEALVLPVDLTFEAERILNSLGRVGTADNDINALKSMGKFRKVVANHYLTDTDAWFIRTNCPDGMKYFSRRDDDFDMDEDWDTDNAKYKGTARYSFGMTDPRGIFGSPGAA